ncbi:MAG: amino acid ABC transporter permease, partial [Clostridia bacterium]|nr:amino acid ABC transporter permease [Clostridia bacterium]
MKYFSEFIFTLFEGFGNTMLLFVITLVVALPLGLLLAFGSMSRLRPVKYAVKGLIWIIRGTPLMLQILLVSFLPSLLFKVTNLWLADVFGLSIKWLLFVFVAVAFIINYACYFSEIFRAGIEGVSVGQTEAGEVLGLSKGQIFSRIVLMQVVKRTIPPMSNEIITLVKDTALAQILGVMDLLNAANHAVNEFVVLTPLIWAALFYLVFNGLLTLLFGFVERK